MVFDFFCFVLFEGWDVRKQMAENWDKRVTKAMRGVSIEWQKS